jgi:hypothetical protein
MAAGRKNSMREQPSVECRSIAQAIQDEADSASLSALVRKLCDALNEEDRTRISPTSERRLLVDGKDRL